MDGQDSANARSGEDRSPPGDPDCGEGQSTVVRSEYEAVVGAVEEPVFVFDVIREDGEFVFEFRRNNAAHEQQTGVTTEEFRGETLHEILGERAGSDIVERFRHCVDGGERVEYDETVEYPGGTVDWRTTLTPITEDGEVVRVVGVARDGSDGDRDRRELAEFRERERTLEQLVERMGDTIGATASETIGQVAVDIAGNTLGAPLAGVHLISDDGERLEAVAAIDEVREEFGVPPTYHRDGDDAPSELVWAAFESGETKRIDDTREYGTLAEETPARSGIVHPLGDHGVLIVSKTEIDGFDGTDQNYIELLSQMLTAVLDRREREREVRELKERLELAVEGAELGVWDWDMRTDEVEFNDQWAGMLGYSPAEIDPHLDSWERRVHPEDLDAVEADLEAHIAGETPLYETEHRMRTADGDWKWIRDLGKIVERDEGGEPIRAVGIHLDVEERKQRERELEFHEMIVEESTDIAMSMDPDGTITYVSPSVRRVLGYEPEGLLGEDGFELQHPDDREAVADAIERLQSEPDSLQTVEVRFRRSDGGWCWIEMRMRNFVGDDRIDGILVNSRNITERKEYEENLKQAREELRRIIDMVPDLIFVKDRNGEFLLANETAAEVYGSTPEEVEGARDHEVMPETEESERFREEDLAVIESGESMFVGEEELTTADGEKRVLQTTKIPYEVPSSGETAVLGYARDVSELKAYERQLEAQRDNLEVLNQVVRHDIRNNLQIASVYAEALLEHVSGDGEEYASKILEAARDAVEITESAREVTNVMIQSDIERSPVSLRTVLEGEIDDVRASHDRALVTVDGAIPDATVLADDMLESVFRNLLTNAIKHNDKEIAEVTVSATVAGDEVVVRIADNGPGVPDHRKDEVFTEGETGLDTGGSGLGLYLVKTLVQRYDGGVSVTDNDPTGAVFVVRLPIEE